MERAPTNDENIETLENDLQNEQTEQKLRKLDWPSVFEMKIESTLTYEDETITYTSEKNNVKDIDLGQTIDDKVAQETTRVKAEEVDWLFNSKRNRIYTNL